MQKQNNILANISRYRTEIMGFAAVWILFYHEWRSLFGASALGKAERFVTEMGFYGVDIFLFLSGMGLVYAIQKYTVREFYKRRFSRLLVPYVLTITICIFFQNWSIPHFLGVFSSWNFWMVDMYTTPWYLYAIMVFYLVFPLYYALLHKSTRKEVFTAVILAVWFLASNALNGILRYDLYGFTNRIPIFITGVLVGEYLTAGKELRFSKAAWLLLLAAFLAGVVLYYLTYYQKMFVLVPSSECFLPDYLVTVSVICILSQLLSLAESSRIPFEGSIRKAFYFFGTMSLEMYCVQFIFLKRMQVLMVGQFPDIVINVVNFLVLIAASYGLHRLCGFLNQRLKMT